jgi:ACS family glucarate transporter-like MFS transporter
MGPQEPTKLAREIGLPSGRATFVRFLVLASACALGFIAYVHRNGFAFAGTDLKNDLNLDGRQWSRVMAAFLIAYAGFEIPSGLTCDKLGARHLLALVTLGWSLLTAALATLVVLPVLPGWQAATVQFIVLLVLRFLFGMFQAGLFPGISRLLTDWIPTQERGTAQGLIWTCSRLGGAVAPFIMGALVFLCRGWELTFVAVSLLGFVWCALVWPWLRNRPEEMKRVDPAELAWIAGNRKPRAAGHGVPWRPFLGSLSVWALCLMYGFGGFSSTFFITLLPNYLRDTRKLSLTQMQWLSGLPLAFGVFACLGGGLFSDWMIRTTGNRKWGRRLSGLIGHACAGVALISTNWVENVWGLAALLSATFFFNDLAMGPAWASCADIGERYAGTLGGAMNMVGNIGGALGALVAGELFGREFILQVADAGGAFREYHFLGDQLVFVVFACSFWLGSFCWMGVDVTKPLTAAHDSLDHAS